MFMTEGYFYSGLRPGCPLARPAPAEISVADKLSSYVCVVGTSVSKGVLDLLKNWSFCQEVSESFLKTLLHRWQQHMG